MTQTTDQDLIVNSDINNIIESLATNHKGANAPSYAKAGMLWLDDSTADMALKIYDGANWALIGRIETQSEFNIGAEDQKVKISATDQNAAELIHKLVAGSGIEMSVINQGLDEKILLDVSDVIHQAIADAATLDIATTAEAIAGTNDTKIMTPLKVKEALQQTASNNLIGVKAISSSTTYNKNPAAKKVMVFLYGAGGGGGAEHTYAGANAGDTKFGTYMTANGGQGGSQGGVDYSGALMGAASGGDANVTGGGHAGGQGGHNYQGSGRDTTSGDGASGGFCFKEFDASTLPNAVSITIAAGGQGGNQATNAGSNGADGLCLIYEYA